MDANLLAIIGVVVGAASFFGLFKYSGKLSGKWAAMRSKQITKKTVDKLKTEEAKQFALETARKANEIFMSDMGHSKMGFLVNALINFVPGKTDDEAIREWAQGFFDGYRDEINKP